MKVEERYSLPSASPPEHQQWEMGIFIDLTHLYTRACKERLWVDDVQLYHQLTKGVEGILGVFAYLVIRPDQEDKVESLRRIGYQVSPRIVQPQAKDSVNKKDIDTWLTSDMCLYAPFIKTLVVVSSDSDYAYALKKLKEEQNKRIEVIYFSDSSLSNELKDVADKCTPITSFPGVCKSRTYGKKTLKPKVA
jgi:uncharacterized LabA/DUF88 family protein